VTLDAALIVIFPLEIIVTAPELAIPLYAVTPTVTEPMARLVLSLMLNAPILVPYEPIVEMVLAALLKVNAPVPTKAIPLEAADTTPLMTSAPAPPRDVAALTVTEPDTVPVTPVLEFIKAPTLPPP